MKNNKKLIIALASVVVLAVVFFFVYKAFGPKTSAGSKAFKVEVVNSEGATKEYEGKTDAEYLKGLMDQLAAEGDFSYEGSDSEYGLFITAINGESAVYETDGAYWSIYVNGSYGEYGADQQPVMDGDTYSFVYERADQ